MNQCQFWNWSLKRLCPSSARSGKSDSLSRSSTSPRHLIDAIIAVEDIRFYHHHGFDPEGILRALYTNLRHLALRQGGSTITQQLAKSYFLTPERTLSRKLKELLMSITIEIMYTKNEILEIYLNEIYLGQKGSVSINGVGEASNFYFRKPVSELSLAESATDSGPDPGSELLFTLC